MSQIATANESKSEATSPPSVLTELGLGNTLVTTEIQEGTDATLATTVAVATKSATVVGDTDQAPATQTAKQSGTPAPAKSPEGDAAKETAELAGLKKQLKDTRDAFTRERQVNVETQRKIDTLTASIAILSKKVDGTYDETTDGPKVLAPEVLVEDAKKAERVAASHWAAVEQHGEEYVMKTIWNDDAPFRQFDKDPAVQARVFSAKLPILEAIKVVKEAEAKAKYGNDPDAMRQAIAKELTPEIEKQVRQQLLKELKAKDNGFEPVKGLGDTPSIAGTAVDAKPRLNFDSLFPGFVKSAG